MKRLLPILALAALFAGCGQSHPVSTPGSVHAPAQHFPLSKAERECPRAENGLGQMGACAPTHVGLTAPQSPTLYHGLPTYVDLSNNDPCYCGAAIRATGHVGEIDKANQGTHFVDTTAVAMIASARAAGLAVGLYDFDETYTVAEARVLVTRLHAAGIYANSRNTFPAIFDVEYGAFSLAGLRAQIRYVESQGYRVAVYTGAWYWTVHAGCVWVGRSAWLAGYPSAPVFCGLPPGLYQDHQYTDHGQIAGGHYGDVSVHTTGLASFRSYVRATAAPKPKPLTKKQKQAKEHRQLNKLYARRASLRSDRLRHKCATRPTPSNYRRACNHWTAEGAQVNREIRAFHARHIF